MISTARIWHAFTFVLVTAGLVLQFVLVCQGHTVLDETAGPPTLATRVGRFFCYFTILSNALVAITTFWLACGFRMGKVFRVLRLNAITSIALTAIVHWVALRPLLDLEGASHWADQLLHVYVPLVAVVGWLVFGPRGQVTKADLLPSAIYPTAWMAFTMIHGEIADWYPYPFIDVDKHGYGVVFLNSLVVLVLLLVLSFGTVKLDERLSRQRVRLA